MITIQVLGDDTAVVFLNRRAIFKLNAIRSIIINNFLHSARLLCDGCEKFPTFSVEGTELNKEKISDYVHESVTLVTALSPVIGYIDSAHIAEKAMTEGKTLKQAALDSKVTEQRFDEVVDPHKMVGAGVSGA